MAIILFYLEKKATVYIPVGFGDFLSNDFSTMGTLSPNYGLVLQLPWNLELLL